MTNIDNERAKFEKWAWDDYCLDTFTDSGEYVESETIDAWQGWLARAKSDKAVGVEALYRLAEHFDSGGWRTGVDYVNAMMEAAQQIRTLIAKETGNG